MPTLYSTLVTPPQSHGSRLPSEDLNRAALTQTGLLAAGPRPCDQRAVVGCK